MRAASLTLVTALALAGCRRPPPAPRAEAPAPEPGPELGPAARDARGDEHLLAGRFDAALADFDAFLAAHPGRAPHHWRRGIALYYAGRYADGVAQFEAHRDVNPADVENAAWHYLCKARLDGPAAARTALLPVGPDGRVPMTTIYALFAGRATPDEVVAAADGSSSGLFYAHLYLGLHYEARGEPEAARRHIELAATRHAQPGYMGDVARLHAALLAR